MILWEIKYQKKVWQNSDFVLTVQTDKTGLLDVNKIDSCYNFGYDAAIKNIGKIKTIFKV